MLSLRFSPFFMTRLNTSTSSGWTRESRLANLPNHPAKQARVVVRLSVDDGDLRNIEGDEGYRDGIP